jgi:hypothetical protein
MRLIVTIDTEEDNWAGYREPSFTTGNIEKLPELQRMFDEFAVRPTYLVTHVVATDPRAAAILRRLQDERRCEIGAHCHPWNTPPVREELGAHNSMLCNLTPALQREKLRELTERITERFGCVPVSFRAGRWAYSQDVALAIVELGYEVDSSISPYMDWSSECGVDYSHVPLVPYSSSLREVYADAPEARLDEIPTTIGYLQRDGVRAARLHRRLSRSPWRALRVYGVLNRLGLLNRVWLCPEHHPATDMIRLTRTLLERGCPVVNMMVHSCTLLPGATPFVSSETDAREFVQRIRIYLEFATAQGLVPMSLAEAARELRQPAGTP